jgi:transcriptional regulator with XRE-family HTH domain
LDKIDLRFGMSLGSYLRNARETRHLTLEEIAKSTKIKRALLADLEKNDVSRWPTQRIYRHGYLRAYAHAVGLEPTHVLARFDDEFGDQHPVAFHGRPRKPVKPVPFGFVRTAVLLASLVILIGVAVRFSDPIDQAMAVTREPSNIIEDAAPPDAIPQPSAAPMPTSAIAELISDGTIEAADIEGELRITSRPPNAHVTVNGIARGPTPVRVRYLPLGTYTVRVIHPGYRIGQTRVTLKPEQPAQAVRIVLQEPAINQSSDTVGDDAAGRMLRESSRRGDASGPSH